MESDNVSRKEKKRFRISIVFKSVFGIVLLLTVFSVIVGAIGYNGFTEALLEQYSDDAFYTADTAVTFIDTDRIDAYAESGGKTEEYLDVWNRLEKLCNSSGVTFIYVIRPDLADYGHITFLFSTINENSQYTCYDFGYVRETTNDEYREKYRRLYEGGSERELVIRDKGYIETDPHITAMIPLKDSAGKTTAILCVQRQMDSLVSVRNNYIYKVLGVLVIIALLVVAGQSVYLHIVLLKPIKSIMKEASRFADENTAPKTGLSDVVKNNDEIGVLAASIELMEERIVKYVDDLTKITAEKERIGTELSLAARIQIDMLPSAFPAFPERHEFDIYALMDPAKEVGGDFYDFFMIDDDHLCLVIADVSGKGIPAALFMMASKIIISDFAKTGKAPADILTCANSVICSGNKESMFVTVWLGILEISTGRLVASNAGHEPPLLMLTEGGFELFRDRHSIAVGTMEGVSFKEYEIKLSPGAKLFLYTDGVTEASNADSELFGKERLLEVLNEHTGDTPQRILQSVRESVDDFVKEAEQFDDLTMMCLEYKGKKAEDVLPDEKKIDNTGCQG